MARDRMPDFDDDFEEQSRKINSLSSSIKKLEESDLDQVSDRREINRLMSTTSKIIAKLGYAAEAMTRGIKNVTVGSAKYTAEAIKQYGAALQEDVQLDKGRLSVLAAKGGPVVGYFIAKMMETPAFKNSMDAIKNKISETMSIAGQKFKNLVVSSAESIKEGISNLFRNIAGFLGKVPLIGRLFKKRIPKELKKEPKRHGVFVEEGGNINYYPTEGRKKKISTDIPKLAKGGVVGEGGLARLHSAEVVMPLHQLMRLNAKNQKKTVELVTTSLKKVSDESYEEREKPFYKKFLDGLFDVKAALVKQPNKFSIRLRGMWERLLDEHPLFRMFSKIISMTFKTLTFPLRVIFHRFGGKYRWYISRDPNPMVAIAKNTGTFFPLMTFHQDQMIQLLKLSLEAQRDVSSAISGKRYGPLKMIKFGRWSIVGVLFHGIKKLGKEFWKFIQTDIGKVTLLIAGVLIAWKGLVNLVFKKIEAFVEKFRNAFKNLYLDVKGWFTKFYNETIKPLFTDIWDYVLSLYEKYIQPIVKFVKEVYDNVKDFYKIYLQPELTKIYDYFKKVYDDTIQPFIKRIENSEIFKGIVGFATSVEDKMVPVLIRIADAVEKVAAFIDSLNINKKIQQTIPGWKPEVKFGGGGGLFGYLKELAGQAEMDEAINLNFLESLKKKREKGNISEEAFKLITSGPDREIGARFAELLKTGQISKFGSHIVTQSELNDPENRARRIRELYIKPSIEKAREASEGIKEASTAAYNAVSKSAAFTGIGEFASPYMTKAQEGVKELSETLKPIISQAELATMEAKDKALEYETKIKSTEEFQKGMEEFKKFQGVVINNFNNMSSVFSQSMSNAGAATQQKIGELGLDPNIIQILRGDLE